LNGFAPHLETLPAEQQRLWPSLAGLRRAGFVLYGGTAIALRCGHRVSVDFDFFSSQSLERQQLCRLLPWWDGAQVLQDQPDTLTVLVADVHTRNTVKVSFFGGLSIGRVAEPDPTVDGVAVVAAPLDLLGTKLKVILQRAERKDYEDVAVLLRSGLSLAQGLAAARALYGSGFPVRESLKALVFFEDGDLGDLTPELRQRLEQAVLAVDAIPALTRISDDLIST
jgi:hypothetical protein